MAFLAKSLLLRDDQGPYSLHAVFAKWVAERDFAIKAISINIMTVACV